MESLSHTLWSVVKTTQQLRGSRGSRLAEGDVIKFGRVHMRVKQLSAHGEARPLFPELVSATPILLHEPSLERRHQVCRVCLGEHQTSANPLVAPCKCIGERRYIHVTCLQEWIKTRLIQQSKGSAVAYLMRRMDCELCKENLPLTISYNDEICDLIQIAIPDGPFIVLEDLRSANYMTKGLHVLSLKENGYFRIGRSEDCEIYLSDASISRFHANITLYKEGFYLEDRNSKFGSMLKLTQRLTLLPGISATLQANNTIIRVLAHRRSRLRKLFCCFKSEDQRSEVSNEDYSRKQAIPKLMDVGRANSAFRLSQFEGIEPGTTMRRVEEEGDILVSEDA